MGNAEYLFNDDLLVSEKDRAVARQLYPSVYEALDHPELWEAFAPIDRAANRAKARSWQWGLLSVVLVAGALLAASAGPLFHGPDPGHDRSPVAEVVAVASAVAGTLGALLGFFGVLFAGAKRRWLQNRMLTERLRQFHFQSILALAPEILAAAVSGDWTAFRARRAAEFARFRRDVIDRVGSVYDWTIGGEAEQDPWLLHPVPPTAPTPVLADAARIADELFAAYKRLRIDRQLQYALYKLRNDGSLFSTMPITQAQYLGGAAFACVLALIGLHVVVIPGVFLGWQMTFLHVLAIWLAIAALALRTIEEGLKPHREVERYRHYRSAIENIERKFADADATPETKLAAMADLERLSFDEMVNFLKSNHEARFVM